MFSINRTHRVVDRPRFTSPVREGVAALVGMPWCDGCMDLDGDWVSLVSPANEWLSGEGGLVRPKEIGPRHLGPAKSTQFDLKSDTDLG
jgi:hypothetical protein